MPRPRTIVALQAAGKEHQERTTFIAVPEQDWTKWWPHTDAAKFKEDGLTKEERKEVSRDDTTGICVLPLGIAPEDEDVNNSPRLQCLYYEFRASYELQQGDTRERVLKAYDIMVDRHPWFLTDDPADNLNDARLEDVTTQEGGGTAGTPGGGEGGVPAAVDARDAIATCRSMLSNSVHTSGLYYYTCTELCCSHPAPVEPAPASAATNGDQAERAVRRYNGEPPTKE